MVSNFIHNSIESALSALKQPPRLCLARKGANCFCDGCNPGDTFDCIQCHRLTPYCLGADDDCYNYCDYCAAKLPECTKCKGNSPSLWMDAYCQTCWESYCSEEFWKAIKERQQ